MSIIPLILGGISTVASIAGAKKTYDAQKEAARKAAEVGKLQARQYVAELFATEASANLQAVNRMEEHRIAESQNIAHFSAMGRSDRSVEAFMKRNEQIAKKDIQTIERQVELQRANLTTAASVASKYGQSEAAGIRSTATANLLTNMSNIAQNVSPLFAKQTSNFVNRTDPHQ